MFKHIVRQFAAMAVIASSSICIGAQTGESAGRVNSITVSITLDKSQFKVGESPVVILTMNNPTNRDLYLHGNWDRVHIDGKSTEPPTMLRQRMTTGKLLPGEAPLREDQYADTVILAKNSLTIKFVVKYLYDLKTPDKYNVYVDVRDPLSGKWLRSNTEKFEIQAQ